MTHTVDAIFVFQMASAILYVALGAWVFTLEPRRRQTTLLGVFAVLFGLNFLVFDVSGLLDYWPDAGVVATNALALPVGVGASLAVLALAWTVAQPLEDRRLLAIALAAGVGASLLLMALLHVVGVLADTGTALFWTRDARILTEQAVEIAAMVLLVLRAHPARRPGRDQVIQLALLAVALATLSAFGAGTEIVNAAGLLAQDEMVTAVLVTVSTTGVGLVLAGLWGWNMLRAEEETVRIHRAAMLGILGLMAAGALYASAFPELYRTTALAPGLMRTLGVGLLAYGVLRHDLAGLDAKVEYGLSKTTVAGVFVAVFFIVSEGAQALFADFAGNEFLGVIAAGMLVFVISPLQRFADRFAAKAVPGDRGGSEEDIYRRTVSKYLADGDLTSEEERDLGELATRLGIDAGRAVELRQQIEDEAEGGEPA